MNYILLVVGFFVLIKGADIFVDGASSIARKLGIPAVIVGLTIVSLGTSAPELAVSLISSFEGNNGITVGNVLGSNIFNTLVVLGASALVMPMVFKKVEIKRDYIINTCVAILVSVLIFGIGIVGEGYGLSRVSGFILLAFCIIYTIVLIMAARGDNSEVEDSEEESNIIKKVIFIVLGVIAIVLGGQIVVDSASNIALSLGMSEKLVGLTIVSIGTSLPELVTSVVAASKGEKDIAIGNVLGSNIFNILLILGLSASINPIPVAGILAVDFLVLIGISLFIGIIIFFNKGEDKKITRAEGALFIALYISYLSYIIIRN